MTYKPETKGKVEERLWRMQKTLDNWAKPLGNLDMLRYMVAELIDVVQQLERELREKESEL